MTTTWAETRRHVLARDNHTCRYCGKNATHVDHVIPRRRGGPDREWNLVAACAFCNISKSDKLLPRWGLGERFDTLLVTVADALAIAVRLGMDIDIKDIRG